MKELFRRLQNVFKYKSLYYFTIDSLVARVLRIVKDGMIPIVKNKPVIYKIISSPCINFWESLDEGICEKDCKDCIKSYIMVEETH